MGKTVTMTLTDFLEARIAEDEAVARASMDRGLLGFMEVRIDWANRVSDGQRTALAGSDTAFLAAQRPARVLAECAAKRRILAQLALVSEGDTTEHAFHEQGLLEAVVELASVHADHPGYRAEWAS